MHTEVDDPGKAPDEGEVDLVDEDIVDETIVLTEPSDTDNVGDVSVEINVEELVAELEAMDNGDSARRREIRRRLDELREEKEAVKDLGDTYAMDLDDED